MLEISVSFRYHTSQFPIICWACPSLKGKYVDVLSYGHSVILLFETLELFNEYLFIRSTISIFQSFAWSSSRNKGVGLRAPYIVDVTKITFEYLDALLRRVSEDLDGTRDWPPPAQEKECIAVAALNLLRLQVRY